MLNRNRNRISFDLNICYLPQHYWATPFKIHTPAVEDFGRVYHSGGINSQMRFLDKVYHRESKYLIQKCQMSVFTWNSHSTMLDVYWIFHRGVWNSNGVAHCLHLSTKPGPWQRNFVDARFPQFHMFPTVWSCATTIGLPEFYIQVRLKVTCKWRNSGSPIERSVAHSTLIDAPRYTSAWKQRKRS